MFTSWGCCQMVVRAPFIAIAIFTRDDVTLEQSQMYRDGQDSLSL